MTTSIQRLDKKIRSRAPGLCFYGIAPPKRSIDPMRVKEIAAQQMARISKLPIDGLILYDIQDESDRNSAPRPFPFLPTISPGEYAHQHLRELEVPKIIYMNVSALQRAHFRAWLNAVEIDPLPVFCVLVGAASAAAKGPGYSLERAYSLLASHDPGLTLGGIAIAERHARKLTEHERMLKKTAQGCRFFVTQAVYDASSTKSMLSDYALALEAQELPPVPVILTFCPCGSEKTLALMKWLGISIPRWLENELKHSKDILERSMTLCERTFEDVLEFAREKGLPIGINVESIAIRKAEIEASVALLERLKARMG